MRIAVVSANRQVIGGAEAYLRWLLPALVERGHELCVAFERDAVDPARALDRTVQAERCSLPELGLAQCKQRLLGYEPDLVYTHGISEPTLEAWLVENFTAVAYAHAFHGACATGTRRHTFPVLRCCERTFGPACLALNHLRGCGIKRPDHLLSVYGEQRARARLLPQYAAVVVASRHMRDLFVRHGVSSDRIRLLPYPTLEWSAAEQAPARRPLAGSVLVGGRVTSLKGLDHAVRAVALAQRWLGRELTLTVAGEGPELEACVRLAAEVSLKIVPAGWVEGAAKRKLFGEADVLLVPSLWPEPFGIVGIEAGALGTPAVGYAAGGIPDWLHGGVSGELAETFDSGELGRALVRALRDPEHHAALGRGAWEVARRHAPERHLEDLELVLRSLVSKTARPLASAL
jgi:glycosyltransferase involved in cell wall biosynthesis